MFGSRLLRKPATQNSDKLFKRTNVSKIKPQPFYGHAYKMIIPFKEGPLSKEEIKNNIKKSHRFCGDGTSITIADLASYLNGNTVIYHYKDSLGGVMVVGPKSKSLYIHGICVPKEFKGVGKKLMSIAKQIARDNGFTSVRLECYGEVYQFYQKQGYRIVEEKELSNSNSNNESEPTIKYVMEYIITGTSPRTPRTRRSGSRSPRTRRSGSRSPRTPKGYVYPLVENVNK